MFTQKFNHFLSAALHLLFVLSIGTLLVAIPSLLPLNSDLPLLARLTGNLLVSLCLLLCVWCTSTLTWKWLRRLTVGLLLVSFSLQYAVIVYWLWTGTRFDIHFLLDSWQEAFPTIWNILGPEQATKAFFFLFVASGTSMYVFGRISRSIQRTYSREWRMAAVLACFAIAMLIDPQWWKDTQTSFVLLNQTAHAVAPENHLTAYLPDNQKYDISGKENVFILQLESLNALAVSGLAADGTADFRFIPEMAALAKANGVFLPFTWGAGVQTHRGLASILCSVSYDFTRSLAKAPELIDTLCLPDLLKQAGYQTVFLSGNNNPNFENKNNFLEAIGVDDRQFATFMDKKTDDRNSWGYNDCTVYEKGFDYLQTHYGSGAPLMATFEVAMHHSGYKSVILSKHKDVWAYPKPSNFSEYYLNSVRVQDHCLPTFFKRYNETYAENSHLFILADHSIPMVGEANSNEKGASTENFLLPLVYAPPHSRQGEFRIGETIDKRFAQEDILPTIAELLTSKPNTHSFAFALKKTDAAILAQRSNDVPYEDCHMMSQPYNGEDPRLFIARGDNAYVYSFKNNTLDHFDIGTDLLQKGKPLDSRFISFKELEKNYFCPSFLEQHVAGTAK
jgi:hypothetical protein